MATPIELHNVDVPDFLAVLDSCKGNVYLVTREGDKLNLRSKLCQLVGLTQLIEGGKIAEAYIIRSCVQQNSINFSSRCKRMAAENGRSKHNHPILRRPYPYLRQGRPRKKSSNPLKESLFCGTAASPF